jgi:hypothetical protein
VPDVQFVFCFCFSLVVLVSDEITSVDVVPLAKKSLRAYFQVDSSPLV